MDTFQRVLLPAPPRPCSANPRTPKPPPQIQKGGGEQGEVERGRNEVKGEKRGEEKWEQRAEVEWNGEKGRGGGDITSFSHFQILPLVLAQSQVLILSHPIVLRGITSGAS